MTEPEWDHPPVTLGRALALLALAVPGLLAWTRADRTRVLPALGHPPAPPTAVPGPPLLHLLALLVVAVAAGLYAAPRMGFNSRVQDRINYGTEVTPGLRADLRRAAAGAFVLGLALTAARLRHPPLAAAGLLPTEATLTLAALHGGLVEELLLRWGLLSAVALGLTALAHQRLEDPAPAVVPLAVVASALLAGLARVPAASAHASGVAGLGPAVVAAEGAASLVYGLLLWRQSLEASMMAHALTPAVVVGLARLPPGVLPF